jgi:hypothetical protein
MVEQEQELSSERSSAHSYSSQLTVFGQKVAGFLKPHAKWLVLLACMFLGFAIFMYRYDHDPVSGDIPALQRIPLDAEYAIAMRYLLADGQLAGRDFHFTYGVVGQLIFAIPKLVHSGLYESYNLFFLTYGFLYWSLFAIFLFSIKKLDWKYIGFIYLLFLFMQAINGNAVRSLVLLFPALIMVNALKANKWKARIGWSLATGLVCFAGFLFTYEIGIYTLAACGAVCGGLLVLGLANNRLKIPDLLQPVQAGAIGGIILGVFVVSNLILSIIFKLTSPNYENLFDFQYYALEMIRGYSNVMGRVDGMTLLKLIIVLLLVAYVAWFIIVNIKILPIAESYLFIALFVASLPQIKTLFSRASAPFALFMCLPLVFVIIGFPGWKARHNRFVWSAILVLYIVCWGSFSAGPFTAITGMLDGTHNVAGKIEDIFKPSQVAPNVVSPQIKNLLDPNPQVKLFTFPYQYSQALAFGKQNPHPLIQSYVGMTFPLQDKVVRELEQSLPNVEVLFSGEAIGKGSDIVDGTPDPTRNPRIFEYIFSRFEIKQDVAVDERVIVLKHRATPRGFQGIPLEYTQTELGIALKKPTKCTMVRLTAKIDYPITRQLTHPNPFMAHFNLGAAPVVDIRVVPLEIGKSFSTYLPLYERNGLAYREMFANRTVAGREWDILNFKTMDSGYLAVDYSNLKVEKVECIQL